jgi:DNA mismatch repair protein MutL
MSDIIRLLPDAIANQIAAGEVVQRPASVIKELLENAIDAEATRIQVVVQEAGKQLVRVIDNGKGMTPTDARMCLERHATSKIRTSEDLFKIRTMGFRGEAMASIAAVAQMELRSRPADSELGTCLVVEGSEVKSQEPVACEPGTSISVKNLFYNVPARRNFLKSNGVEMKHILEEFQRVALAFPEVAFTLYQNDLETYNLPAGKLSQRIVNLFDQSYREQLAACKEDTPHLKIHGYVGKPEFAKKTRGEQFFFVNQRFIKNNYLNHAVLNAFQGLLPDGNFPFYVLFIDIDPAHVDVNVHPTKTEIKFVDERLVYGIVRAAVRQALGMHNITQSLDFSSSINLGELVGKRQESDTSLKERNYGNFRTSPMTRPEQEHWHSLYEVALRETHQPTASLPVEASPESPQNQVTVPSMANQMTTSQPGLAPFANMRQGTFQLHFRYIVTQVKSGMMLVDQQAAHERVLYEKYMLQMERRIGISQQSLFPQSVRLSPTDFALVHELQDEIRSLGFEFEVFGKDTLLINGVPADVVGANEKELFEGLIEQFKRNKTELSIATRENLCRSMARKGAIKSGQKLSIEEMNLLIDSLFGCKTPNYAPNGQATIAILDIQKIETLFK